MSFNLDSPNEVQVQIAKQAKEARLQINLSQEGLASRAGVSLSSLKRFENSGRASIDLILKIALVLDSLDDFKFLFNKEAPRSLDEILNENNKRQRGRKK